MSRRNKYTISQFVCLECGNKFPLPRPMNQKREKYHIKDLYCPHCKKITKTEEVRYDDFFEVNIGG